MPEAGDIAHITDVHGVKLVRLRSDAILTEAEVEALGRALVALAEVPGQRAVLSFLGVRGLTSLALGQLIHAHKRLTESGGDLRLADIDPQIYEVFAITRLDQLFRIFDREDEAIASYTGAAET